MQDQAAGPPPPPARRSWLRRIQRHSAVRRPRWLIVLILGFALGALTVQCLEDGGAVEPLVLSAPLDAEPDVAVTFSEGLLTALIQQSIARGESPLPLQNVRVVTSEGRLTIHGRLSALGRGVDGLIEMEPVVEDGLLRLRMRRARLGPVPAPANLERLAEGPVNVRLAAALGDLPATITSARVDAGGLTVTARVRTDELPALSP